MGMDTGGLAGENAYPWAGVECATTRSYFNSNLHLALSLLKLCALPSLPEDELAICNVLEHARGSCQP